MRIKLKYPDVDTFLQKYGPNISRGGVFISTKAPRPVGTAIRFDFVLVHEGKEQSVLRGEGTVHFVKDHDASVPGRPHGMGIKFVRLFDDGQALIDRALSLRGAVPEVPSTPDLPAGTREITGEVELANPRDISSGEFQTQAQAPDPELDIDALVERWHVSLEKVDEVLRRPRSRDAAREEDLAALLEPRADASVSRETAAAELEQLLVRKPK